MLVEPLSPAEVKRLIRDILENGSITFSKHALAELAKDDLTTVDATNIFAAESSIPVSSRTGLGAIASAPPGWR